MVSKTVKARKFAKQHGRLALPALELGYAFGVVAYMPRTTLIARMIPAIHALQENLKASEGAPDAYEGGHGGYWDDLCLAGLLEGVCMRFVAYPERHALVDSEEKLPMSREEAEKGALAALQRVLDNGHKIELDHHLVYYAHYELGRLHACMGQRDEARKHFDLVLSGKPLEANASTRKGKYSLESVLIMRTHAAVEALDHSDHGEKS